MRDYRFHGFTRDGAHQFAGVLRDDGFTLVEVGRVEEAGAEPGVKGWRVQASGDDVSEGLLELLAQFYGGSYDGEGMSRG